MLGLGFPILHEKLKKRSLPVELMVENRSVGSLKKRKKNDADLRDMMSSVDI